MLQRGFGERRGKDYHPFKYEKGTLPRQNGTKKFGAEKCFYGPEDSPTDTKLTKIENILQGYIQDARGMRDGETLNNEIFSHLVTILEVRSQFLREELSTTGKKLETSLNHQLASSAIGKDLILAYFRKNPEIIEGFLAQQLIPINQRKEIEKLITAYVESLDPLKIQELFKKNSTELVSGDMVKDAHNGAILSLQADSPRHRLNAGYSYSVYRPQVGQLILPDTCVAFIGNESVAPFSNEDHDAHTVVVPLSSDSAAIGVREGHRKMELKTVNRLLAGCAYKAFLARTDDARLRPLTNRIGKHAKLIKEKDLRDMLSPEWIISKLNEGLFKH
jgi:hypothetical protein